MSAKECVVCAWRATCTLKFRYQTSELHCKEFTHDVTIAAKRSDNPDARKAGPGQAEEKKA